MKWICRCGEALRSSGEIPNPIEWLLHSDVEFDQFTGTVQAEYIYGAARHAFRCPACDRLYVHWHGLENEWKVYVPEVE